MRVRQTVLSALMMFACVLAAAPARAADIDGKWTGSLATTVGPIQITFNFKADGATLTGTGAGPDGTELPIANGKIDGDRISFVVTIDFGRMTLDLNCTGQVSPDTVKLSVDIMGMPLAFE